MRNTTTKLEGYQENNGIFTVTIQKEGKGTNAVYNCFLTRNASMTTVFMFGLPVDQRRAIKPHIYTAEEIMEIAIDASGDYAEGIVEMDLEKECVEE